ncbi:MAG: threonine--tRNA ligase [Candidatus Shapirobacteria bacterium]
MNNTEHLKALRHSAEHVLTQAMLRLYPKIKMAMGPATDEGFYFDFDSRGEKITEADFPKIEAEMRKIVEKNLPIKKEEIGPEKAQKLFADNPYKQEWLAGIRGRQEKTSVYWTGEEFVDLCSGPHVASSGQIGAFKLLSVAGAYWHGDEKKQMLTRIYGTAFPTQKELDKYLWQIEEAKKRDHRKLGAKLGLWTFSDLVGAGLPLFTQKGALVRRLIVQYVEELQSKQGIAQVWTPQIAKAELFKISGHYDKYQENMFAVKSNYSEEEFFLKPMNCPQHTQIYAAQPRSYRDLPIRMSDFAMLYRDEKPGELLGLARVRSFSQDDCHIFCREDQIVEEMNKALDMTHEIMTAYGFKYRYRLSLRDPKKPEKYIGDAQGWEKSEKLARQILDTRKVKYFESIGEAAFYGPKVDLIAQGVLNREWQLSTLQIDFFMPERFKLTYTDQKGQNRRPVMLHRAIVGSPERLMMILLEHYAGALPVWLAPIQVAVLPVSDKSLKYGQKISQKLSKEGIRVDLNDHNATLGAKIRDAEEQKIPYMLVAGEREAANGRVNVRVRGQKSLGEKSLTEFTALIKDDLAKKRQI